MMIHRTLLAAAAALATTLAAHAQTVLKAADVHPPGYPTVVATEAMGKKFEAATNGKYKMKMFPLSVLGDENTLLEHTQVGAI